MSNELNAVASMNFSKNGALMNIQVIGAANVAGTLYADVIKAIPTSSTSISFGNIAAGSTRWFCIQNLDNTNYVEVSFDSGATWPIRLLGDTINSTNQGGFIMAQAGAAMTTVHLKANTATCQVSIRGVEA